MRDTSIDMFGAFYEGYKKAGPEEFSLSSYKVQCGLQAIIDAGLLTLPIDTAKIREDVIRECLEALPKFDDPLLNHVGDTSILTQCHGNLRRLLPTKDKAEELAKEYLVGNKVAYGICTKDDLTHFARWMIAREKVEQERAVG